MATILLRPSPQLTLPALLRERPALRAFIAVRAIDELGVQMLNVAVAWHVYAATRDPMSLAWLGLARFLPNIGTAVFAGHVADRFDRRCIVRVSLLLQALGLAALGVLSAAGNLSVGGVYFVVLLIGVAQALSFPAMSAIEPRLVSAGELPRAVALSSSAFQICTLTGPAVGGLLYAFSGPAMFLSSAAMYFIALTQVGRLPGAPHDPGAAKSCPADGSPLAGIRYIRSHRLLFSVVSLDLAAVLVGGVTALLPIYARDILLVGAAGLGWLRCAPGIGAAIVGLFLSHRAIGTGAGKLILACVAGFGLATVVFATSTNFWLSLAALIAAGGFDMVGMVIRQTLVQAATPDAMRGRVGAVQWVCIGASSELGEFESGATAAFFGAAPAALLGGLGTLAVAALWAWIFPELPGADGVLMR